MLLIAFLLVKAALAYSTPLGYDFQLYLPQALYTSAAAWSPWLIVTKALYEFWLWLPVVHVNPTQALIETGRAWESVNLLSLIIKSPLILSDFLTAFILYHIALRNGFRRTAASASILWLANPLSTLFIEMWGSIDIIPVTLTLLAIDLLLLERSKMSSLALMIGIALKMSPIVAWGACYTWISRKRPPKTKALVFVISLVAGVAGYFILLSDGDPSVFLSLLKNPSALAAYDPVTQTISQFTPLESNVGFAVTGLTAFFLIASNYWPAKRDESLIGLALASFLFLYGLAVMFPTALLWALPLMILWALRTKKYTICLAFHAIICLYLVALYATILTSGGSSLLFIPIVNASSRNVLSSAVLDWNRIMTGFELQVRALLVASSVFYGASVVASCTVEA